MAVTRIRSRDEVHMSLLSHFVGAVSGRMLLRLKSESPMKMMRIRLYDQHEIDRCLEVKPHLFCVNRVNDDSADAFESFVRYYLVRNHFLLRDM